MGWGILHRVPSRRWTDESGSAASCRGLGTPHFNCDATSLACYPPRPCKDYAFKAGRGLVFQLHESQVLCLPFEYYYNCKERLHGYHRLSEVTKLNRCLRRDKDDQGVGDRFLVDLRIDTPGRSRSEER